jgi:hypothetical protein
MIQANRGMKMLNMDELKAALEEVETRLYDMQHDAETAEDWAEITRVEDEEWLPLIREYEQELEANSQFGVGA